jgi:hypothetical protein
VTSIIIGILKIARHHGTGGGGGALRGTFGISGGTVRGGRYLGHENGHENGTSLIFLAHSANISDVPFSAPFVPRPD